MIILEIDDTRKTGEYLKKIRLIKNINQADAAKGMGMMPETLSRMERGIKSIGVGDLEIIAKYYGIDEVRIQTGGNT